eukprot:INCI13317.1.p1 GENE.INCI13317.1~~INCI13317.1.p1  ORF type:complete len:391 (+),score=59.03 INCI13317.1:175-1347(+)
MSAANGPSRLGLDQAILSSGGAEAGGSGGGGAGAMTPVPTPNPPRSNFQQRRYVILAAPPCEDLAEALCAAQPDRFRFFKTKWGKFSDSQTDNIELGGFTPRNYMMGSHVLFLASFHNNDIVLSQFSALVVILESFIESLTVVLPFFPHATMERCLKEGQVATANTMCRMFSVLPSCGRPTRVMIYDIHTLQNRFYLSGHALASLGTSIPLFCQEVGKPGDQFDAVFFPDDGAQKRFGDLFKEFGWGDVLGYCAKIRRGEERIVDVQSGPDISGARVVIVDDMVRSGGTLAACAEALVQNGAKSVSAFVAHAGGTLEQLMRFSHTSPQPKYRFERFYLTDSVPTVIKFLPQNDVFRIISLLPQIVMDLDNDWGHGAQLWNRLRHSNLDTQ